MVSIPPSGGTSTPPSEFPLQIGSVFKEELDSRKFHKIKADMQRRMM
jgi:hypothetical protein